MWDEKYRPKTLDEIVGQKKAIKYFKNCVNNGGEINHCILKGPSGTGKTSITHAVANELGAELIEWNASDERGLDFVRNKVIPAMKHPPFNSKYKILFLDEAENMLTDSLNALRRPLERYRHNAKVIFAYNTGKLGDAILSRCIEFNFTSLSKKNIVKKLRDISKQEGVDISNNILDIISEKSKGDLRKAINLLESYGKGSIDFDNEFDNLLKEF